MVSDEYKKFPFVYIQAIKYVKIWKCNITWTVTKHWFLLDNGMSFPSIYEPCVENNDNNMHLIMTDMSWAIGNYCALRTCKKIS